MKKLLFFASAAAMLALGACKKEKKPNGGGEDSKAVVSKTQQVPVFYFGGTWCPPCGAYGKPAKEYLKSAYTNKAHIISCQVNGGSPDPMNNASANGLASIFGVTSVPSMFFGGGETMFAALVGSGMSNSACASKMDEKLAIAPIANMKFTTELSGNDLTIRAQTQFFKDIADGNGTYFIAAYLTEDGLNYSQATDQSANKNIHDNVLRLTVGATAYGDILASSANMWDVKNFTFFGTLNAAWKKEKMGVTVVLWKRGTDNKLTCVNSWSGKLQ
jgi:hypothetical protein